MADDVAPGVLRLSVQQTFAKLLERFDQSDLGLVGWKKRASFPAVSPMTAAEWTDLHEEMDVRLMVIVTTLLDYEKYDWQEHAALHAQRWDIELQPREVETTLGCGANLRVKLPENANRILQMALIAYNLIK